LLFPFVNAFPFIFPWGGFRSMVPSPILELGNWGSLVGQTKAEAGQDGSVHHQPDCQVVTVF
jgi:hypothetical protein